MAEQKRPDEVATALNRTNFHVLSGEKLAVVWFWALWDRYDLQLVEPIARLKSQWSQVAFYTANMGIEAAFPFFRTYNVYTIPCFIVFSQGQEIERVVGFKGGIKRLTAILEERISRT